MTDKPIAYSVTDIHTRIVISTFTSRNRATSKADKLDLAYGAYRYIVTPIWKE
jgi:hypothetical protein